MPKRFGSAAGRNVRIIDQIQHDLVELIQHGIKNPTMGLVTLQSVTFTPNYAYAEIYFTVLGAEPEVAGAIPNGKAGHLHSLLFKRLRIHTAPALHFHSDGSVEHGIEMSRLTDEANATCVRDD